MTRHTAVVLLLLFIPPVAAGPQAWGAERAGQTASITIGYFEVLGDHNLISVEGLTPTFSSDNIFIGGALEGPVFWSSFYPVMAAKWMFDNRYDTEDYSGAIGTTGFLTCVGIGYGLNAWQATLRLEAMGGYWWEDVSVDYSDLSDGGSFEENNDQIAALLRTSLAFPFAGRVNALMSFELLLRPESEIRGSFEGGRSYQLTTNGIYGNVSIGLSVRFKSD